MTMRQSVFIFLIALLLSACNSNTSNFQWEYRIVPLIGQALPATYLKGDKAQLNNTSEFESLKFMKPVDWEQSLNLYGKDGWELVSTYSTIETVFPNFGDKQYHTGVKENTRTNTIYFVFKRKKEK